MENSPAQRALFYVSPFLVFLALLLVFAVVLNPLLDVIDKLIDPLLDPLADIGISEPVLQTMLVSAILALSIYITLYGGMFSLANAGFMGIGAYAGAILTINFEWAFGPSLLIGMIVAGVTALIISLPVLRLRNIYLAIATIGFGQIVVVFFNRIDATLLDLYRNNERLYSIIGDLYEFLNVEVRVTSSGTPTKALIAGGASGLKNIPRQTETAHLILFLILICYIMYRLQQSRFGRALDAIRQDERVAASQGINVVYYKNAAFFIGALVAGAAGVFDAHRDTLIEPKDYGFSTAVDILAYAVLGGITNWIGPVLGGLTLQGLPELLRELREYSGVITGLTLLLTIVYLPGGLLSLFKREFWSAGGRFYMARRVALTGIIVIFIVNVFPYQGVETVAGRILGYVFLTDLARAAPWAILLLAATMIGVRVFVLRFPIPAQEWQPVLVGTLLLLTLFIFYQDFAYLVLGNLLPILGLFWVVQVRDKPTGGRYASELAIIAGVAAALWIVFGLFGMIENVMLGYYLHSVGLIILAVGCLMPYPPLDADQPGATPPEHSNHAAT
ncbi:branched-chain amino acid ABC transporter permease [Chloroflexota bacterium]